MPKTLPELITETEKENEKKRIAKGVADEATKAVEFAQQVEKRAYAEYAELDDTLSKEDDKTNKGEGGSAPKSPLQEFLDGLLNRQKGA